MGGSIQCDLSFSTFSIDQKDVKITREPRVRHMIEYVKDVEEPTIINFIDTGLDTFRVEELKQQEEFHPTSIDKEVLDTP